MKIKRLILTLFFVLYSTLSAENSDNKNTASKNLIGYWAIDETEIIRILTIEAKAQLEAKTITQEEIKKKAQQYSKMMLMNYTSNLESSMFTIKGVERSL